MLLAFLFCIQDLETLGHDDPEERLRAASAFRRPDALPLLLRGRRHPDPEVRAGSVDLLRRLSPLAWVPHRTSKEALDVLRSLLRSPAPDDAARRSQDFVNEAGTFENVRKAAPTYGQVVIPIGPMRDVDYHFSDGVIWAGRPLPENPDLLAWILGRLDDPLALSLLAQMLPRDREDALLDDPRPEAVDLLLYAYVLWKPDAPLDPRFAPRLAARLHALDGTHAGAASLVLKAYPKDLATVLAEGAASPNRWSRYLSAAITATTPGTSADPAVYARLLRDPDVEIRREAVRATLARAGAETWDRAALLEAVEGLPDLRSTLRLSRDLRMQAAAVDSLRRTPEASLAVLEDCDDPAILDAAAVALRDVPALLARSTAVLRRLTETSEDPAPRRRLMEIFDGPRNDEDRERAAFALGGLPAGEILGFLEERLSHVDSTIRVVALYGLRRVGSRAEDGSCLAAQLRGLLRARAEVETDPYLLQELQRFADGDAFVAHMPHRLRRMTWRSSCGHRNSRPQGGWRELPAPAVPLPAWK